MRAAKFDSKELLSLFKKEKVLMLDNLREALGTDVRMTVFRKLKELSYCASYSHTGKYYTLKEIAEYDEHGLWNFGNIRFSKYGSLKNTIETMVCESESGYFAHELQGVLNVNVHIPLLQLFSERRLLREQIVDKYLYLSPLTHTAQLANRKHIIEQEICDSQDIQYQSVEFDSPQIKKSLFNFLSALNEKQRRLYAGFESMKLGYGGDSIVSKITGIDIKTVGRGRQELESCQITPGRIRNSGGGRQSIKKNGSSQNNRANND